MEIEKVIEELTAYTVEAAYGAAILEALRLEGLLVLLLTTKLPEKYGDDSENFKKAQNSLKRLTMGKLIKRTLKEFEISEYWEEELDNTLFFRNHLVHNIAWQITNSRLEPDGQERLVQELTEIRGYFSKANLEIMKHIYQWFESQGISREMFQEMTKNWIEIVKEERKRDSDSNCVFK